MSLIESSIYEVQQAAFYLGDDHDPTNKSRAVEVSLEKNRTPLGIIYRETRPTYGDKLSKQRLDAKKDGAPSFDDLMKGAQMVIEIRQRGSYANLIHLMQCGHCGYESPIETEPEDMTRQCYCCGATNTGGRGSVNIIAGMDFVSV